MGFYIDDSAKYYTASKDSTIESRINTNKVRSTRSTGQPYQNPFQVKMAGPKKFVKMGDSGLSDAVTANMIKQNASNNPQTILIEKIDSLL
jgi:hypothetical protein